MIKRASIPPDAKVLVELGTSCPTVVPYDPIAPFEILWVVTNGKVRRNFIWVTYRKTGIYAALGIPGFSHASYHADGTYHWKHRNQVIASQKQPPFDQLDKPVSILNGTTTITDDVLTQMSLREFKDHPVDSVLYLDNRVLPSFIAYNVYAIPPFRHGEIPLIADWPATLHIVTQTNPWIAVVIYEQKSRPSSTPRRKTGN